MHIRNEKFGKLKNGLLVVVGSDLIKKQARHMVDLSMGVKLILGMNGWIWLEPQSPDDISAFEKISKLANILRLLGELYVGIRVDLLLSLYNFCQDHRASEILQGPLRESLIDKVAAFVNQISKESVSEILTMRH